MQLAWNIVRLLVGVAMLLQGIWGIFVIVGMALPVIVSRVFPHGPVALALLAGGLSASCAALFYGWGTIRALRHRDASSAFRLLVAGCVGYWLFLIARTFFVLKVRSSFETYVLCVAILATMTAFSAKPRHAQAGASLR
jgi:hypothetical protein